LDTCSESLFAWEKEVKKYLTDQPPDVKASIMMIGWVKIQLLCNGCGIEWNPALLLLLILWFFEENLGHCCRIFFPSKKCFLGV